MFRPKLLVILVRLNLNGKLSRVRNRHKRHPPPLKFLQPGARSLMALIDAENFDFVATARDMESPIPRAPHKGGLRVERIVPTSDDELGPAFGIKREVNVPSPPGEFVLLG